MIVYINETQLNNIRWQDFRITDNIDNKINTCNFRIINPESIPTLFDEIEVYHNEEKIFAGNVLSINKTKKGLVNIIDVNCVDYTYELEKYVVVERFADKTADEIITALLDKYHPDFTNLSDCDITFETFTCNNITVLEAIEKLADATNYRWYVDYDKNLKFFAIGTEVAPFNLEDGTYEAESLRLSDDGSQIRNGIKVRGGNYVSETTRTEKMVGDGENTIFGLNNKFATIPTIEVDGVEITNKGIEYIDEGKDAYWNYNEKYIRFDSAVADGEDIEVTGYPLIPIVIRKYNNESIKKYGIREVYKRDNTLGSKAEVLNYATVQLEKYKNQVVEGKFVTSGQLKSGQIIEYDSESYLIQSVNLRMATPYEPKYEVSIASTKTIEMINFLQSLIRTENRIIESEQEEEPLLSFRDFEDDFAMEDALQASGDWVVTSPPYTWEDTTGDVEVNPIVWNKFTWEYEI